MFLFPFLSYFCLFFHILSYSWNNLGWRDNPITCQQRLLRSALNHHHNLQLCCGATFGHSKGILEQSASKLCHPWPLVKQRGRMLTVFISLVDCDSPEKQQQQGRCPSSPHSPGTLILGTSWPFEISIHDNQNFHNLSLKALLSKVVFGFWVLNLSLLSWVCLAKGSLRNMLRQRLSGPLVLPPHLFQDRHPKIKINEPEWMTSK